MGWNQGYSIFESTVIGAYDIGVLDRKLLTVLMEPYRGTDIDSGGERGLLTRKDKLNVNEVVLLTFGKKLPAKPEPPKDRMHPTDAEQDAWDAYHEKLSDAFYAIVRERFGWR